MRRLRKTGAVDQGRKRRNHPAAAVRHRRQQAARLEPMVLAEKVEHLLGMSLDRMAEILGWPADGLDPYRLAAQTQVIRVVAMVAAKAGERRLDAEAEAALRAAMAKTARDKALT